MCHAQCLPDFLVWVIQFIIFSFYWTLAKHSLLSRFIMVSTCSISAKKRVSVMVIYAYIYFRYTPEVEKFHSKNKNLSRRKSVWATSLILALRQIIEGIRAKNLEDKLFFVDISKELDFLHWKDGATPFLHIVSPKITPKQRFVHLRVTLIFLTLSLETCKGDSLAPSLSMICQNYWQGTSIYLMKENGLTLKKVTSCAYPAETMKMQTTQMV